VAFWVETYFQWVNPLNNWSFGNRYVTNYQRVSINGWWFGTMEFYDFPYIGNFIIPTDELHHFSEG
jgi:hypothetical protein